MYLWLVDEGTHVAHNPSSLLLGVSRPVTQASVHDRHDERQAGSVHSVDEDSLQESVQGWLGVLVGVGNSQQQRLHQALHFWVADHPSNLQHHHRQLGQQCSVSCRRQCRVAALSAALASM